MKLNFFKKDDKKKNKSYSLLVVPDDPTASTKSHKFTSKRIISWIIGYTIFIALIGYLFLSFTGLGNLIYSPGRELTVSEMKQVDHLNKKLLFLTKELEGLKNTNDRLKYAIILGDSSLIDSLTLNDSTSKIKEENPYGGDLLAVVQKLFFTDSLKTKSSKNYFFISPVDGFISRGFNPDKGHFGIDFVVKKGTPVYASANGYVIFSDFTFKDGNMLIISHPNDYITVYKHCSSLLKKQRDIVLQGEIIALSGNTGEITTGPHLHFEIWKNGYPIDPEKELINY